MKNYLSTNNLEIILKNSDINLPKKVVAGNHGLAAKDQ